MIGYGSMSTWFVHHLASCELAYMMGRKMQDDVRFLDPCDPLSLACFRVGLACDMAILHAARSILARALLAGFMDLLTLGLLLITAGLNSALAGVFVWQFIASICSLTLPFHLGPGWAVGGLVLGLFTVGLSRQWGDRGGWRERFLQL